MEGCRRAHTPSEQATRGISTVKANERLKQGCYPAIDAVHQQ